MSIFQHVNSNQCLKMGQAGHSYNNAPLTFEDCEDITGFTEPMPSLDNAMYYQLKDKDENKCIVPDNNLHPDTLQSAYEMMEDTTEEQLNAVSTLGYYIGPSSRLTPSSHTIRDDNQYGQGPVITNNAQYRSDYRKWVPNEAVSKTYNIGLFEIKIGASPGNTGKNAYIRKKSGGKTWNDHLTITLDSMIDRGGFGNKVRDIALKEYGLTTATVSSNKIWVAGNNLGNEGTIENWNALKQAFKDLDYVLIQGVRSYTPRAVMGECDENSKFKVLREKQNTTEEEVNEVKLKLMFSNSHTASVNGNRHLWSHEMTFPLAHRNTVGELGYEDYHIPGSRYMSTERIGNINWKVKKCPAYFMSGEYFIGAKDREHVRAHPRRWPDTFKIIIGEHESNNNTKKMLIMRLDSYNGGWGMNIVVRLPMDLSIYRMMFEREPEINAKYSFLKGGPCHNDINVAMNGAKSTPGCVAMGQQGNGCWHYLKKDTNGKTILEWTKMSGGGHGTYAKGIELVPVHLYNTVYKLRFKYLGCYEDRPTRALPDLAAGRLRSHHEEKNIIKCAKRAQSINNIYFGLQHPQSSAGPHCTTGHSIHRARKYGKKNCDTQGTGWGNSIYVLYPGSYDEVETHSYFTFYDIDEKVKEKQLFLEPFTMTCKIKYTVEAVNSQNVVVGTSVYYLVRSDEPPREGVTNHPRLFFTPQMPDSKKDDKFIIDSEGRWGRNNEYKDDGRDGHGKYIFTQLKIKTKDGYNLLIHDQAAEGGLALTKGNPTVLRAIPLSSIDSFKFMYHYPKTDQTLINLSSLINPFKKIYQWTQNRLITRNYRERNDKDNETSNDNDYIFKLNPLESFTPRTSNPLEGFTPGIINEEMLSPVYSMGGIGDWPWRGCPGFKDQNAEWIWHTAGLYAKHGSQGFMIYTYENTKGAAITAQINIIVDNFASVYVNGDFVGHGSGGWRGPGRHTRQFTLNPGTNTIIVNARNGGGPAGLLLTCYKPDKCERKKVITDDNHWDCEILFSTNVNSWNALAVNP